MQVLVESYFPGARNLRDEDDHVPESHAELDTVDMHIVDEVLNRERLLCAIRSFEPYYSSGPDNIFPALHVTYLRQRWFCFPNKERFQERHQQIELADKLKYLGVFLDRKPSWKMLQKKQNAYIFLCRRINLVALKTALNLKLNGAFGRNDNESDHAAMDMEAHS